MHGRVLMAAGASTRIGRGASKGLQDLVGMPVLCRALDTFRAAIPDLAVARRVRAREDPA